MLLARDVYTITAADIAASGTLGCVGRRYHHQTKQWHTLGNPLNVADSPWPREPSHRIRSLQVMMLRAGVAMAGIRITVWSVINPEHPDISTMLLVDDYQTASHLVKWQGDHPMAAGVEWRVSVGGLLAADVAGILVGYEQGG